MSALAMITARGGSKRIPGKNIREFCGRPILCYSIEAALQSGVFDEVMVSTDSGEIREIALRTGAKVPFLRSAETSNDYATTSQVVEEVLEMYRQRGQCFELACCIYPTAPFVTAQKLRDAMEKLQKSGADTVSPVVRFSYPPQRALVVRDGRTVMKWPENLTARSQDLEPFYHDCGQFYCFRTASFLEQKRIFMDNMLSIEMPESQVQDIDTPEDWKIAEMKYRLMVGE